jgi:TRAP-type transport system periplasmic protein
MEESMRPRLGRSRFLITGIASLGSFGIIPSVARAAQFQYKLATSDPNGLPRQVRLVQMANAIKAETNGRMEIQLFPNSILGSQTSMLEQLRLGSIQFYSNLDSGYASVVPVAAIDSVGFAFTSQKQPAQVLDGALGAYLRKEFSAKGLYLFENIFEAGFRQVTSSTKPIQSVEDFVGFKIRTPSVGIFIDLFRTLGASPVPIDSNALYTSLQTHLVDGAELPLDGIEYQRVYEVQRYLSITNHIWAGFWLAGNLDAWNALPPDIQTVVNRNAAKHVLLERKDSYLINVSVANKLKRQGLILNTLETAPMRARLAPYYARWKRELGSTAWSLLEDKVGKLG